eukprot:TRINITY_DN11038_c0_g2_i2.p1 TRINITY_DN11038_c0_g2~~TRINITY_DN11038_c0_g2_i2.p1  ORF type:complete len:389 (-),score=101.63 TRINITY_DN11038_c0_g2_i2:423-1523(-)
MAYAVAQAPLAQANAYLHPATAAAVAAPPAAMQQRAPVLAAPPGGWRQAYVAGAPVPASPYVVLPGYGHAGVAGASLAPRPAPNAALARGGVPAATSATLASASAPSRPAAAAGACAVPQAAALVGAAPRLAVASTASSGAPGIQAQAEGVHLSIGHFMLTPMVRGVQERFERFLALLQERRVLTAVRPAAGGVLRIGVPFCGGCFEAPTLAKFLQGELASRSLGGASSVEVLCTDVLKGGAKVALEAVPADPRLRFSYEFLDLATAEHPAVDLILGMHPEVTRSETKEAWKTIIARCVAAAPVSVFATLQENEADVVKQAALAAGAAAVDMQLGLPLGSPESFGDPPGSKTYDQQRYSNVVCVRR